MIIDDFNKFMNKKSNNLFESTSTGKEIVKFHLSNKLSSLMASLKDESVYANLLYYLISGKPKEQLVDSPIDYLDIDDDGMISFLKPRYFDETDKWNSTKRVKLKSTKIAKEIYKESYLNSVLKQTDIESFINVLKTVTETENIFEYKGDELLRAYNYRGELAPNFGSSCANFKQSENKFGGYSEPTIDEFYVYTENPDNCKVIVVWEKDKIVARKSFQQGIQLCDVGNFKKGELCTIMGRYYGVGGQYSKYNIMINRYLTKKYKNISEIYNTTTSLCISMETRWENYPPFDNMYVSFDMNLLTNNYGLLPSPYRGYAWSNTYHAGCPKRLVNQRIKEESEKKLQ